MTTYGATSNNKVGILTTLHFQCTSQLCYHKYMKWGMLCQKQVSMAGISNYIPQYQITSTIFLKHALLCLVVVWHLHILPMSFRVTSLALGQSYDCPSVSEATLKNMGKKISWSHHHNWSQKYTTKQSKTQPCAYSWDILYMLIRLCIIHIITIIHESMGYVPP